MRQILIKCLLCLNLIFIAACSTQIKQAGKEHATAISKWNELARYSESKFTKYPIAITAQLTLVSHHNGAAYQLSNIQLTKKENSYNINLLAPNFEHKYICHPICYQLLEYVEGVPASGSTLLNEYFTQHEFELFSFYGELYKMNDQLTRLANINQQQLGNFLDYISLEKRRFNELNSFISYLSVNLSDDSYQLFLNDPTAQKIRQKTSQVSSDFTDANDNRSSSGIYGQAEGKYWMSDNQAERKAWESSYQPEREFWLSTYHPTSGHAELNSEQAPTMLHGNWIRAKNDDIALNDYVCTYADNKFGRAIKLSDYNIYIELIGQAKFLQDGILYDLEEGALFNSPEQNITFLPRKGSQSFSLLNVARCQPQ